MTKLQFNLWQNNFPIEPMTKMQFDVWWIYSWTDDKITHWPMTKIRFNLFHNYSLSYDKITHWPMTNLQFYLWQINRHSPVAKMQFGLCQKYSLTCDKFIYRAVTKTHIDLHVWQNDYNKTCTAASPSVVQVVSALGLIHWHKSCGLESHSSRIFLGKISNSILSLRLDYGVGYATCNVSKFFIHCKTDEN